MAVSRLPALSLSLQFGRFKGVERHRAALPRHSVTRWIRHALDIDPARSPCASSMPKRASA
jgi:probable rRNA maturation factor